MPKKRGYKLEVVAPAAVLAALAAGMAALLIASYWTEAYDPRTFCPEDGQYARTAVLIDATDSLGAAQIKAVKEQMNAMRGRLELHEWTGIFVLNGDNLTLPAAEIALCNPGSKSTCNPLFANCEDAERQFNKQFAVPMQNAVDNLAALPARETSPILEMIRAVALDRGFDSSQKRRLIIVSDMLQNVPEYSHYKNGADFAAWQNTDYGREFLRLSLAGVDVEIWYVRRAAWKHLQTRGHVDFWEKFFAAAGASVRRLQPL